ncbi:MAG: polymer-forming cytoskeletal protein [Proteobacteria bacterium]|nr:polymer-forming cytoskeletal protein [Pseudomonadota bacterium]
MLGSKKSGFGISGSTTLVSCDTVIVGDIHFSGNLDIEGLVQGNIIALPDKEAFVRVVHGGRVEGEIRVPAVVINGAVEGNVYSSKHLELATKGRVHGDVFYALVEMAAGSEVNGALKHIVEPEAFEPDTVKAKSPTQGGGDPLESDATEDGDESIVD